MDTRAEQTSKAQHAGGRKIGFRLTLSFAAVVALMTLGSVVALWQFDLVQAIWTLSLTAALILLTAGVLGARVHETTARLRELYDALRRSEEHYRALYEDTPSMYFTVDPDGTVASVNRFGATYLGFAVEDLIGQQVSSVFFDEDKAVAAGHLATCLAQPERVFEWRLRKVRKDGSLLWVKETARAVRAQDGRLAVLIVCEDITESVRAEATEVALRELLESAAVEWELTFDAIEAPILILNVGGRIARFNRAARELAASVGCLDLTSRAVDEVAPAQPWQKAGELAQIVAKTRDAMHAQVRDAPSGRTWDLSAGPGTGPADEERVIVVARDVTRMAELQESLRRSETMSAMGGLVAGVAHEVRNPLFGISANLDAFEARYGDRDEYRRMTAALRAETDRLATLMKELLDYGRPAYEKPSPERMHDVVADALDSCAELARRRSVTVVNEVPDQIGPVLMDRKRITQALQNLVENAIQHTLASGRVTIEAQEVQSNGRGWIACSVSDSGAGIAAEDLPRIFEPFFTRRKGGTGLGLSIVQRIVELHGGSIEASNRPGGGASMTLRLPRADAP